MSVNFYTIHCPKCDVLEKKLNDQNEAMAKDGLRVITIANGKIAKKDSYKESDIKNTFW